jgi:uncharacterized protein
MHITTLEALRSLYNTPQPRALQKQIATLDLHSRRFIELSPFVLMATSSAAHDMDASPRGGAPGFIKVAADGTLLIPDAPGNNRLDSLENIITTGRVGLLFLIPGFDETLRVNGAAVLSLEPAHIALCSDVKRTPKLVIQVSVQAVYLHCAKAFMRSRLWQANAQVERSRLPTAAKMISDQTGIVVAPESQAEMAARYAPDL